MRMNVLSFHHFVISVWTLSVFVVPACRAFTPSTSFVTSCVHPFRNTCLFLFWFSSKKRKRHVLRKGVTDDLTKDVLGVKARHVGTTKRDRVHTVMTKWWNDRTFVLIVHTLAILLKDNDNDNAVEPAKRIKNRSESKKNKVPIVDEGMSNCNADNVDGCCWHPTKKIASRQNIQVNLRPFRLELTNTRKPSSYHLLFRHTCTRSLGTSPPTTHRDYR